MQKKEFGDTLRRAGLVLALSSSVVLTSGRGNSAFADEAASTGTFAFRAGQAHAEGFRMTGTIPGFPATENPVDGGGPRAEARAESTGTVQSLASAPYPGELAANPGVAFGLVSGLTGARVPGEAPAYPFMATASYPGRPAGAVDGRVYFLDAQATERAAKSVARAGLPLDQAGEAATMSATSEVVLKENGVVLSNALTTIHGFSVGPLTIASITSRVSASLDASGNVERSSTLEFQGVSVDGTPVVVAPNQVGAALGPINSALTAAGMRIDIVPEHLTDDGAVISSMLRISSSPPMLARGNGQPGKFAVLVGYAMAKVQHAGQDERADAQPENAPAQAEVREPATLGAESEAVAARAAEARSAPVPQRLSSGASTSCIPASHTAGPEVVEGHARKDWCASTAPNAP